MKRTYYRVGEVADMLHVTPESVRAYVRAGKIHCDRTPSGQRVFTQEHIDAYLGNAHTPKHVFYARSSKGDRRAIQAQLDELEHTSTEHPNALTQTAEAVSTKTGED